MSISSRDQDEIFYRLGAHFADKLQPLLEPQTLRLGSGLYHGVATSLCVHSARSRERGVLEHCEEKTSGQVVETQRFSQAHGSSFLSHNAQYLCTRLLTRSVPEEVPT